MAQLWDSEGLAQWRPRVSRDAPGIIGAGFTAVELICHGIVAEGGGR